MNATVRSCAAHRACWSLGSLTALGGACRVLWAASAAPFAAPMPQVATSSAGGMLRVVLALIVVLAAVLAAAWLARRMRALSAGGSNASLEVLAQLPLGTRERAVLIRVGELQLLIGVAAGNVRTLHVLEQSSPLAREASSQQPPSPASDAVARPSFKALLLRSLGK